MSLDVYASQPDELRRQVEQLLQDAPRPDFEGDLIALIVPDSNRLDSAAAAAAAVRYVEGQTFDVVMAVSASHDEAFGRMTVSRRDTYPTPLGEVTIDDGLRNELCDEDDDIFLDDRGHFHAEGVSAMLPLLQVALEAPFRVVPIVMGDDNPAFCRELGTALGEVMYGKRALLVASADVLGVEGDALARFTKAFEDFDTAELLHLLGSETLRVEGYGAVIVTALAARARGANRARVVALTGPTADGPGAIACALWRG